jgi:signal transduction histidine kinase
MNPSHAVLIGHYNYPLVVLSLLLATTASYAAFDLAGRVTAAAGYARVWWILGGATACGIGTWSMHYVGMLAFRLPILVQYDWPTALISLFAAVCSYVVALFVVSGPQLSAMRALAGGAFMGSGIVALNYIAMSSMRLRAECHYSPILVTFSAIVAVTGSLLALWLVFFFKNNPVGPKWRKTAGATLMGLAIAGMHYTAMAASTFTLADTNSDLSHAVSITALGVVGMVVVPLMVLVIAVLTSVIDRLQHSFEQLRELANRLQTVREEERRRIAREIHDDLGQALTAIKIGVSSLLADSREGRASSERAEATLNLINQAISSVRKIATELRPAILDDLGLVAAIEWAAEEFEVRTETRCRLSLPANPLRIDQDCATAVFRIFQEILTNVSRHSNAMQVDVRLSIENEYLELEVQDNGIGADQERLSAPQSLGIMGMRERALLLRGEFSISGKPNQGTLVRVRIPLVQPPDQSANSQPSDHQ